MNVSPLYLRDAARIDPHGGAILRGNFYAASEDVRAVALSVLRHRVLPNFAAEAESITTVKIVQELLAAVPEPKA